MGGALWPGEPYGIDFLKKSAELGSDRPPKSPKMEGIGRQQGGIGHLLVQNRSQEVQEHFGSRGKAKNPKNKIKNKKHRILGSRGPGGIELPIYGL